MSFFKRKTDPETSQEFMDDMNKKAPSLQARVLKELNGAYSGRTCSQLSVMLDLPRDTISPLMPKLERKGLAFRSGYKRKMFGHSRRQIVWLGEKSKDFFSPSGFDEPMEEKPKGMSTSEKLRICEASLLAAHNSITIENAKMCSWAALKKVFKYREKEST